MKGNSQIDLLRSLNLTIELRILETELSTLAIVFVDDELSNSIGRQFSSIQIARQSLIQFDYIVIVYLRRGDGTFYADGKIDVGMVNKWAPRFKA
jgi:hypothetical protein